MRKVICFLSIVLLTSCNTKRPTDSLGVEAETITNANTSYYSVSAVSDYEHDMHYKVYNSAPGHIFVINVTKDSLEVEMLKRSLEVK